MTKLLIFLSFLVLLLVPLSSAGQDLSDTFEIFAKLHDMDVGDEEGDDLLEVIDLPSWHSHHSNKNLINVEGFGAVGDGAADDTQAFRDAWKRACSTPKSVFLVPEGRRYLVNATRFRGPCLDKIVIQIDGTIVAPDDPNSWDPKNPRTWLVFNNLTKVYLQGKGVIDGSGTKWWAASCKKNKSNVKKFHLDSNNHVLIIPTNFIHFDLLTNIDFLFLFLTLLSVLSLARVHQR